LALTDKWSSVAQIQDQHELTVAVSIDTFMYPAVYSYIIKANLVRYVRSPLLCTTPNIAAVTQAIFNSIINTGV